MKIVCFSEIQWRYVRTRKQQIISRFPGDWEVLFLSSVVAGGKNNFRPIREGNITHVCIPVMKNFPQKTVRLLFSLPPVRFLWNILVWLWVVSIMAATGFSGRRRVFYVSNIYYAAILPFLRRSFMLYDCNDDPLEFPGVPPWATRYFRKLVSTADVTVTVSRGLESLVGSIGAGEVEFIGNGVDYGLFRKAIEDGTPEEMKDIPGPILGYSGAIAQWFDMKLLDMLATSFPEASIVLLGPLFGPREEDLRTIMDQRDNVFYLGSRPYERLGAYIAAMDVCMVPLKMNRLMRMADPNKLYEYAATGNPIVTYMHAPEMEELGDMIYLARSREEFVEKVRAALAEGADRQRLVEYARRCSWDERAAAMTRLIERHAKLRDKEDPV